MGWDGVECNGIGLGGKGRDEKGWDGMRWLRQNGAGWYGEVWVEAERDDVDGVWAGNGSQSAGERSLPEAKG